MAINKVVLGDRTLIDLSYDTATEEDVLKGKYFHRADGEMVEGVREDSGEPGPGGGGTGGVTENDVNFYDYDGTLLYSYPIAGVVAMTELPEPPAHEGLTFQEWNWTLDEIKEYEGQVNVGATYITDDGKTRFYIAIEHMTGAQVALRLCVSTQGDTVVINWGDGTGDETNEIEAYSNSPYINRNPRVFSHTYTSTGEFVITISSGKAIGLGYSGSMRSLVNAEHGVEEDVYTKNAVLKKAELGNVSEIHAWSFNNLYNIETVNIPKGVVCGNPSGSSESLFVGCHTIKCIVLPRGFGTMEEMFNSLVNISHILLPGNMSGPLETRMIANCDFLKTITVPSKMTSVGKNCFQNDGLVSIFLPPNINKINEYGFSTNKKLSKIRAKGVTRIGKHAFYNCSFLQHVEFSDYLESIGEAAFYGCAFLKGINVPDGVTNIANTTFSGCKNLKSMDLPPSVESIGTQAFQKCISLEYIDFSKHTAVPTLSGTNAFTSTPSGMKIRVPAALYDEWVAATNWSSVASKIVAV